MLLFLSLIWGSSYILIKKALTVFPAQEVACLRLSFTALILSPILIANFRKIDWSRLKYLVVVGLMGSGIPAFLFPIAQMHISSSITGILNALTPLFTLFIGVLVFRTNWAWSKVVAILIGLSSASMLVLMNHSNGGDSQAVYSLLVVAGTICYAISSNTVGSYLRDMNSFHISMVSFVLVGIPAAIWLLATTDVVNKVVTNEQGQLARGDTSHSASAVSTRFADAVLLAPGEWRTHVLSTDGSLRGSGLNDDLEVTSPRSAEVTAPAPGPTLTERPVAIAPLVDQTCVLHEDGEIACWGRSGVLLPGPPPGSTPCGPNIFVASPVTLPRGDLPAGPLAGIAGDRFAMLFVVWDAEGRTYGMGEGGGGVLGMDGIDVFAPAQTTALRGARTHHVRLGLVTACAILDDTRELVCWGAKDVGQLGRATFGSPEAIAAPPAW